MKLFVFLGEQHSNFSRFMKIRLELEGKNAGIINYKGQECNDLAVNYLNSIEADEVLVHVVNDDGTRADAEFDGEFPVLSAIKFILSITSEVKPVNSSIEKIETRPLSLKERLEMFLRFEYKGSWFSSIDVKKHYENIYGKIGLSTVSTYLARMYRDNILIRRGNRSQREYRFKEENNAVRITEFGLAK